jgi:hypothetical protein
MRIPGSRADRRGTATSTSDHVQPGEVPVNT